MLLAIDPGTTQSAYVLYSPSQQKLLRFGIERNDLMFYVIEQSAGYGDQCVVEWVESYGMPVGAEVFETVAWIGRFEMAWKSRSGQWPHRLPRGDCKLHLCHSARAKDPNVRQALLDKFPATGGGKCPQIGTKAEQGPLYGVSKDVWAALAVAVTFAETKLPVKETA